MNWASVLPIQRFGYAEAQFRSAIQKQIRSMTTLEKGDKAPNFSGSIETGERVQLSDYAGKKLVLYFYPKDDTPTCTTEACNLRDNYGALQTQGYEILGVSPDTVDKHQKFVTKYDLPFHLLADTEQETAKAYGVWGRKKFMGREYDGIHRTTFVINEKGTIEAVIKKVKAKAHADQITDAV